MSANAARLDRARAKTRKALESGFCEAGNHEYCRKSDCPCGCHGQTVEPLDIAPIAPGLYDNVPDAEYRAAEGLSASEAKVLLGKRPPAPSPALALGTLTHVVTLEPHKLDAYVALDAVAIAGDNPKTGRPYDAPQMTGRWKAAVAEAEQDGKIVVSQADWDHAHRMAEAVHNHRAARQVLDICTRREVSGWAEHPSGVLVKGRLDGLGTGVLMDLKTTANADPATFGKACHEYGYHVSMGHYTELARANGEDVQAAVIVAVEKVEPYRVSVMELAPAALDLGAERFTEACRRYAALGRVELPSFGDGFHSIDLPPWAYRDDAPAYQEVPA